ncbi:hypothetical protein EI94DRAFT_632764 [Lactarius quietus]|nr:hypothetical protein EI94DRAFT_632764 [Lactarius quietus]
MSPTTPATKYRDYFFLDGDITIRVENSVFKIDKHFLTRESRILKSLLNPIVPSRDPPGSSEANPFVLDDATSEGFASLLWVFYNLEFSFENTPVDKWKDILFLARQWGITRIEKLCIRELGKIIYPPWTRSSFTKSSVLVPIFFTRLSWNS